MDNFFDQFDDEAPSAPKAKANFFDQFDGNDAPLGTAPHAVSAKTHGYVKPSVLDVLGRGGASAIATAGHTVSDFIDQTIQQPLRGILQPLGIMPDGDPLGAQSVAQSTLGVEREINADRQADAQHATTRADLLEALNPHANANRAREAAAFGEPGNYNELTLGDRVGVLGGYGDHLLRSGVESLPTMALALATRNPEIAAGIMGGTTGAQEYTDLRSQGAGRGTAALAGAGQGTMEVAGEMVGLPFVMDRLGPHSLRRALGAEFGQEFVTQLGQQNLEDAATGHETPVGQQFGDALDAGLVGAGMGGGSHVALNVPAVIAKLASPSSVAPQGASPSVDAAPAPLGTPVNGDVAPQESELHPAEAGATPSVPPEMLASAPVLGAAKEGASDLDALLAQLPPDLLHAAASVLGSPEPAQSAAALARPDGTPAAQPHPVPADAPPTPDHAEPAGQTTFAQQAAAAMRMRAQAEAARTPTTSTTTAIDVQPAAERAGSTPAAGDLHSDPLAALTQAQQALSAERAKPQRDPARIAALNADVERAQADAVKPAKPARTRAVKTDSARKPMDLLRVLAANGGLNREAFQREGVDPKELTRRAGFHYLFRKEGGMRPHDLREFMQQEGYLPPDSEHGVATTSDHDAYDLFDRAFRGGEEVYSADQAQTVAEHRERARQADHAFDAELAADPHWSTLSQEDFDASQQAEVKALAERAYDLGANESDFVNAYFDATNDEHARAALQTLVARLERDHASRQEPAPRTGAGRVEPGEEARPAAGFQLAQADTRAEAPREVAASQGGLFAPPTRREQVRAASESKDASRNGLGRDLVRPEQGDGELLAGAKPKQAEVPAQKVGTGFMAADREAKRLTAETGTKHVAVQRDSIDADGMTVGGWFAEPEGNAVGSDGKPDPGRYVQPKGNGSREQQMDLAHRGSTIATLKMLNERVAKTNPDAAYTDDQIERAANLDAIRDHLIRNQSTAAADHATELTESDLTPAEREAKDRAENGKIARTKAANLSRAQGEADASAKGFADAIAKVLPEQASRVEYVRDYAGLPDELRSGVESRNAQRDGKVSTAAVYDPVSQRVFLVTSRIKSADRAAFHAAHEIAGHDGLRKLLGDQLDPALHIALQNPTVSALADAIMRDRSMDKGQRTLAAEEALAELAAAVRTGDYAHIQSRYGVEVGEGLRASVKASIANFLKRLKALLDDRFGRHVFLDEDVRALLDAAHEASKGEGKAKGSALESTEDSDQTRTPAFKRWFADSKVVDADGKPLVVYHGTASDFDAFSDAAHRSSLNGKFQGDGFHFSADPKVASKYADAARNQVINKARVFATVDRELPPKAAAIFREVVEEGYTKAWDKPDSEVRAIMDEAKSAGIDLNELLDIAEWVEGSNYNKGREARDTFDAGMIFGGSARDLPDWVRSDAVKLGIADALPNPAVVPAYLKADKVLRTSDREAAKRARADGYDGVYYTGDGTVDGEPEWIVFRPEQIKSATANNGNFDPSKPSILESVASDDEAAREHLAGATGRTVITGGRLLSFIDAAKAAGADLAAMRAALALTDPEARAKALVEAIDAVLPQLRPARAVTGTKNAVAEAERLAEGRDPILRDAAKSNADTLAEALRTLKEDPSVGDIVVEKLVRGGTEGVSLADEAILLVHKTSLRNRRDAAAKVLADEKASPEKKAVARREWDSLEGQIATMDEATRASGREWGRMGQFRQRMLRDDYTFAALERKERARLERPLTLEESAKVKAMAATIADLQSRVDALQARVANADSEGAYSDLVKHMSRPPKQRRSVEYLRKAANDARARLAATPGVPSRRSQSGAVISPSTFADLSVIGAYHIANGAAKFADWVGAMRADIGDRFDAFKREHPNIFKAAQAELDKPIRADASAAEVLDAIDLTNITAKDVRKLVAAYVGEGMRGEPAVMAAVAKALELDESDARHLFVQADPKATPTLSEAQAELRDLRKIVRLQHEIERLEAGQSKPARGAPLADSPGVAAKKQELADLRASLKPARDPEGRYQELRGKQIEKRIADLQQRIAAGDFAARPRIPRALSEANQRAQFELDKAKHEFIRHQFEAELAARSPLRKIFGGVTDTLNLARAVMTSLDLSAVFRQGGFIAYAHPVMAAKGMAPMLKAFASAEAEHSIRAEIESRPNARLYRKFGLDLTGIGAGPLTQVEEAYASRWLERVPRAVGGGLIRGSGRAYTTFLNKLRADSFDAMVASLAKKQAPTDEEGHAIANYINVATGRGPIGKRKNAGETLNTVFFAPRLVASRFQLLFGQPLYGGTPRTRKLVVQEYARFMIGVTLATTLAAFGMAGDDDEPLQLIGTDPRSSNFGKIKFGNTYLDPLAGLAQVTTLVARLATGETVSSKDEVKPLRPAWTLTDLRRALGEDIEPLKVSDDGSLGFGMASAADTLASFLRSKLAPVPGALVNTVSGENLIGQPMTPLQTGAELVTPMSFQNITDIMEEQGVSRGTAITALGLLGMGVQYRKPSEKMSDLTDSIDHVKADVKERLSALPVDQWPDALAAMKKKYGAAMEGVDLKLYKTDGKYGEAGEPMRDADGAPVFTSSRLSDPDKMNASYREQLESSGMSPGDVEDAIDKNAVHHIIPDNLVRHHPLMAQARDFGYDLDHPSNLIGLTKHRSDATDSGAELGHWTSHPKYDAAVYAELNAAAQELKDDYGSLQRAPRDKVLDAVRKVEATMRERIQRRDVPTKGGRLAMADAVSEDVG